MLLTLRQVHCRVLYEIPQIPIYSCRFNQVHVGKKCSVDEIYDGIRNKFCLRNIFALLLVGLALTDPDLSTSVGRVFFPLFVVLAVGFVFHV